MPLMYAFVARGQDVLCEYAAFQGNFSKVAVECLAKCPAHNAKFTYNADKHTFNFIVFNGYSASRRGALRRREAQTVGHLLALCAARSALTRRAGPTSLPVRRRRGIWPPNPFRLSGEGEGRLHKELWRDGPQCRRHVSDPCLRVRVLFNAAQHCSCLFAQHSVAPLLQRTQSLRVANPRPSSRVVQHLTPTPSPPSPELKSAMAYAQAHPEEINKVAKVQNQARGTRHAVQTPTCVACVERHLTASWRREQVSEVKNIMMENIEKVLDRGEKLEVLVDKTESLRYQADQFQKSGKALRNKMWWQNIKMKLLVALILSIVIVVIFCFACFRQAAVRKVLADSSIQSQAIVGLLRKNGQ